MRQSPTSERYRLKPCLMSGNGGGGRNFRARLCDKRVCRRRPVLLTFRPRPILVVRRVSNFDDEASHKSLEDLPDRRPSRIAEPALRGDDAVVRDLFL